MASAAVSLTDPSDPDPPDSHPGLTSVAGLAEVVVRAAIDIPDPVQAVFSDVRTAWLEPVRISNPQAAAAAGPFPDHGTLLRAMATLAYIPVEVFNGEADESITALVDSIIYTVRLAALPEDIRTACGLTVPDMTAAERRRFEITVAALVVGEPLYIPTPDGRGTYDRVVGVGAALLATQPHAFERWLDRRDHTPAYSTATGPGPVLEVPAAAHVIGEIATYHGSITEAHDSSSGWAVLPCAGYGACEGCTTDLDFYDEHYTLTGVPEPRYQLIELAGDRRTLQHVRAKSFTADRIAWPPEAIPLDLNRYRYLGSHLGDTSDPNRWQVFYHTAYTPAPHLPDPCILTHLTSTQQALLTPVPDTSSLTAAAAAAPTATLTAGPGPDLHLTETFTAAPDLGSATGV